MVFITLNQRSRAGTFLLLLLRDESCLGEELTLLRLLFSTFLDLELKAGTILETAVSTAFGDTFQSVWKLT